MGIAVFVCGVSLIADTGLFQGLKEALLFHAVTDMFPLFR